MAIATAVGFVVGGGMASRPGLDILAFLFNKRFSHDHANGRSFANISSGIRMSRTSKENRDFSGGRSGFAGRNSGPAHRIHVAGEILPFGRNYPAIGKVQRVDFHFGDPSLVVKGLSLAKSTEAMSY